MPTVYESTINLFGDIMNKDVVYVDVDGTLLLWPGTTPGFRNEYEPIVNVALVKALQAWHRVDPTRTLVVWSANGASHAVYATMKANISNIVTVHLTKPQVFVDDSMQWYEDRPKVMVNAVISLEKLSDA